MKILISSLEEKNFGYETDVSDLNYDREKNLFWMRLVIGDDWFQRVTSSFEFSPRVVRYSNDMCFIVCDKNDECQTLSDWLIDAEKQVDEGYRTMRG